jgi:hypothetical protein
MFKRCKKAQNMRLNGGKNAGHDPAGPKNPYPETPCFPTSKNKNKTC